MKLNNKGFTMVELLAAVAILAILSSIAIVSVTSILNKAHIEYYQNQEKNVILAAQSYMNSNKSELPKIVGKKNEVKVSTLRASNFLKKDLTTYDGKTPCDPDKSHVTVFKYDKNDYSYTAYISCDGSEEIINEIHGDGPSFAVRWPTDRNDVAISYVELTVNGDSVDTSVNLISYSYIISIYNESTKKFEDIINSGNVTYRSPKIVKKLDLSKYTISGKARMRVKMSATNIKGETNSKTFIRNFKDEDKPTCIIDPPDRPNTITGIKDWTRGPVTVTVGCQDGKGSGCEKNSYTKTFTTEGMTHKIKVKDNAGNFNEDGKCTVTTYIDRTAPELELTAYKCGSDGKKSGSAVGSIKAQGNTKTIYSKDLDNNFNEWLNLKNYPHGVCFEIKAKDNFALASEIFEYNNSGFVQNANNYTNTPNKTNEKTYDLKKYRLSDFTTSATYTHSLSADGHRYGVITVKDGAGNTTKIVVNMKIDKTKPTTPTNVHMKKWTANAEANKPDSLTKAQNLTVTYTNNTWSELKVVTYPSGSTDEISQFDHYEYTTTGKTRNDTNTANPYRNIGVAGYSHIKWRSVDKAGNESSYTGEKTIKLDLKAPTIKITAYKCNSSKEASGSSVGSITANDSNRTVTLSSASLSDNENGWLNKDNYPYGVCFKYEVDDDAAMASKTWSWNSSGLAKNASGYKTLNGSDSPSSTTYGTTDENNLTLSKDYTGKITSEGHRYAEFVIKDAFGHTSTVKFDLKVDRTAPNKPSIIMKHWTNNNSKPDNLSECESLSANYSDGSWSNRKVCTRPGAVTDSISGGVYYQYKTTGATENASNHKASYRNVGAEGTSSIQWRSFDEAGNTSGYNSAADIKLDFTDPTMSLTNGDACPSGSGYKYNHNITLKCSDSLSGVASGTTTVKVPSNGSLSTTCKDNAGNSQVRSKSVSVCTWAQHSSCPCASSTTTCTCPSGTFKGTAGGQTKCYKQYSSEANCNSNCSGACNQKSGALGDNGWWCTKGTDASCTTTCTSREYCWA